MTNTWEKIIFNDRFMPWEKADPYSSTNFRRHSVLSKFNAQENMEGEKKTVAKALCMRPLLFLSLFQVLPLAT